MPDIINEQWLPIPGYEGFYSVSNLGRVRSEDRNIINQGSGRVNFIKGKILKCSEMPSGHFRVNLSINSKIQSVTVHSLVLLAFVGRRPDGADICHNNGNPGDNRLENLRYDTRTANIADSKAHGTFSEAEIHPFAVLSNAQVLEIYNSVKSPASELARKYGVGVGTIQGIWRGDRWKSVTGGAQVTGTRGLKTYLRTKLTEAQGQEALYNRANRTGRNDGLSPSATAKRFGVDKDVITTFYAAVDNGKRIIFSK